MALSIVQRKAVTGTGTGTSVTFDATPKPGNKVICVWWTAGGLGVWTTDPTGFVRDNGLGSGANGIIFFSRDTVAGDSATISGVLSSSIAWQIEAYEISGIGQADKISSNTGTGVNTLQASSLTPTTPDSFCLLGCGQAGTNGGGAAIDSSFTVRDGATFTRMVVGDKIKTAISAEAPTASWTTARNCLTVFAVYRPSFEGWGNPI